MASSLASVQASEIQDYALIARRNPDLLYRNYDLLNCRANCGGNESAGSGSRADSAGFDRPVRLLLEAMVPRGGFEPQWPRAS